MKKRLRKSVAPVGDWVELMCGYRMPSSPFEDYQAYLQFTCWLRFSQWPTVREQAGMLSIALMIEAIGRSLLNAKTDQDVRRLKDRLYQYPVIPHLISPPLQNKAGYKHFTEAYQTIDKYAATAKMIATFLVSCPIERSPSLNKAWYFISNGGYVRKSASPMERHKSRPSISTLKQHWTRYRTVTPFYLAADHLSAAESEIPLGLVPDDLASIARVGDFLNDRIRIRRFFSVARAYQDKLIDRLDKRSKQDIPFLTFPDGVEPTETHIPWQMSADQEQLLAGYSSRR